MTWLQVEPQSIVWLPTLHRLAASEAGKSRERTDHRLNLITLSNGNQFREFIVLVPRSSQFSRANCSRVGTDNVRGQIFEHIFAPSGGYCSLIHLTATATKICFYDVHLGLF